MRLALASLFVVAIVAAVLPGGPGALAAPAGGPVAGAPRPALETAAGRLVIRLRAGAPPGQVTALLARIGVRGQRLRPRSGLITLDLPATVDLDQVRAQLLASGLVDLAERDPVAHAFEVPDDPAFAGQWHLQATPGGINLPAALDLAPARGAGVIVAVIDTGAAYEDAEASVSIFPQHFARSPQLDAPIVAPWDFVNDDAHANDDNGHGTHVASTILQATGDGVSGAGIAANASLMPLKVLNYAGSGSTADIVEAIYYAADNGARIINMSLGYSNSGTPDADGEVCSDIPGLNQAMDYAAGHGVTILAASGNDSAGVVSCPAAYHAAIAVGAVRYDGTVTFYSNTGDNLDLVAPGGDPNVDQDGNGIPDGVVQETFCLDSLTLLLTGDYTQFCDMQLSGTSMASPHAAGIAALLLGESPGLNPNQVRFYLETTARDGGAPGWDASFGNGIVDAAAAVTALHAGPPPDIEPPPPVPSARPDAPQNLVASGASATSIKLTWLDASSDEQGFRIERSADGLAFSQVGSASANATSWTNSNLIASTTYFYRVRAFNQLLSGYSNVASAATLDPPAAPSNLAATALTGTTIRLTWTDNATNEKGFVVERSTDGATWLKSATLTANATATTQTNLDPDTIYHFHVRAYDGSANSANSNEAVAITFPPPSAPASLVATTLSSSSIRLTWADASATEQGFKVERSLNGGATWSQIAALPANTTTWTNSSLTPATSYGYRVRAYDGQLLSPPSAPADAMTFPPPAAPSEPVAVALTPSSIRLTWTDNSTTEQGFKIERSADGGANWSQVGTVGANVVTWTNSNLGASVTYQYRLRAYDGSINSGYSSVVSATTLPPPAAPTNLVAKVKSAGAITLTWIDNATTEQGYRVERSLDGGLTWSSVATLPKNTVTYTNVNLSAHTTYTYRVRAYEGIVNGPYSDTAAATTP